ncbi:MAG TPA: hypothetical protein DEA85_01595, partial [Firmicutes bacterium]|nr:hypothetical protein [Bacillota bacterium]
GGKGVALFFVDGFAKDDILVWVMQSLFRVMREQSAPPLVSALFQRCAIRKGLTWLQCTWAAALFMGCTHPFFWCPLFVAPSAL